MLQVTNALFALELSDKKRVFSKEQNKLHCGKEMQRYFIAHLM